MNYNKINTADIANGKGVRVSLFVSGCTLRCPGCFNPQAQKFDYGNEYTKRIETDLLYALAQPYISGLSILGGEPYDQDPDDLLSLVEKMKYLYPNKDIWIWTGHEFEEIRNHPLTKYIDVAICGRFEVGQRDITFNNRFRGSSNQRVIDVKESLKTGKLVGLPDIPNNEIKEN